MKNGSRSRSTLLRAMLATTNSHKLRRKLFSVIVLLSAACSMYFFYHRLKLEGELYASDFRYGMFENVNSTAEKASSRFLIDTPGCTIPYMDPYDSEVKKFLQKEKPIDCGVKAPVIMSNITSIYLPTDIENKTSHKCCYRQVYLDDTRSKPDDSYRYTSDCINFPSTGYNVPLDKEEEFLSVTCTNTDDYEETDYHAFVPKKRLVEERCEKARNTSSADSLSVLILGLDAVSRLNFHRQMPKTLSLLSDIGAVEFLGYNKVGDNTFPNLAAALSGMSKEDISKTCWKNNKKFLDDCPWIWKMYSSLGYKTMFIEDSPYIGTFSFEKKGFKKEPTDYYPRAYMNAFERQKGHDKTESCSRCVGHRYTFDVLLDYVIKFVTTFRNSLYWGMSWSSSISHDKVNSPQIADPVFYTRFKYMLDNNLLNNTALIFMSDHGIRLGKIRETHQGKMEERLPFIFFFFPKWFENKYILAMKNLRRNAKRLTSQFDLYSTMEDLLHIENITNENIRKRTDNLKLSSLPRGISLFLPVPASRTCKDAGITNHWCTCHSSVVQEVNHPMSKRVAEYVLEYLNSLLKPHSTLCVPLSLRHINEVSVHKDDAVNKKNENVLYYFVQLEAEPSGALFEATVKYMEHKNSLEMSQNTISRINRYGDQSACIRDDFLRLICYCTNYTLLT